VCSLGLAYSPSDSLGSKAEVILSLSTSLNDKFSPMHRSRHKAPQPGVGLRQGADSRGWCSPHAGVLQLRSLAVSLFAPLQEREGACSIEPHRPLSRHETKRRYSVLPSFTSEYERGSRTGYSLFGRLVERRIYRLFLICPPV
jgi:hypothetical protein